VNNHSLLGAGSQETTTRSVGQGNNTFVN